MKTKDEMNRSLNALLLELPESIVADVRNKFNAYSQEVEARLLECARNLGNPAYGQSTATTMHIDDLRKETLDFLEV